MYDLEPAVLWRALYGSQRGLIGVHSALRPAPGSGYLSHHRSRFFEYPGDAPAAAAWCLRNSEDGLEVYFCAHLLLDKRRIKANAAPVVALWADADDASLPPASLAPEPTAVVESSPGRTHLFWRLTKQVEPERAEDLNRRLMTAADADRSGWDLSQLLRPPGTRNRKYENAPTVRLLELDEGTRYHPRELELALPPSPTPVSLAARPDSERLPLQDATSSADGPVDLSRLSGRMRNLIAAGNTAAGKPYRTRSEADFAVAIAMFGIGFEEPEIWAVMTDPHNGISERYHERGRHGHDYLARTIGKARDVALPYPAPHFPLPNRNSTVAPSGTASTASSSGSEHPVPSA